MTPAERLAELRDEHGLSAREVAELLGLPSGRTVRAWLSPPGTVGHRPCPYYAARLVALELGAEMPLAEGADRPLYG